MALSLEVLGCDGSWPGPGGACSGYLLRSGTTNIWLDCGSGTFARLQQRMSLADLDAIVISHRHADHCSDLTSVCVAARFAESAQPVAVFAAPEVERVLEGEDTSVFAWTTVDDGYSCEVGDITLRFSRTDHGPPTFAVHATNGDSTWVYSADTGTNWSPAAFEQPIDSLLYEAAFLPGETGHNHVSPEQAAVVATAVGARRLVLTHLKPTTDIELARKSAASVFSGELHVATPGSVFV